MKTKLWSCPRCTFENEAPASQCAICLCVHPNPKAMKFDAEQAKTTKSPHSPLHLNVGTSLKKEQQVVDKKLQQLKDVGIKLSNGEIEALLQRNCFSVAAAASEYFEHVVSTDSPTPAHEDKRMLESVLNKFETTDSVGTNFQALGKITMRASINRRGVNVQVGDEVRLSAENAGKKRLKPGVSTSTTASGIVRIFTLQDSQIGRLERKMEESLHSLMKSNLVKLRGVCDVPPVSSHMFAAFTVSVVVYISEKAFDVFKAGNANFHLSDELYKLLQMIHGAKESSLAALATPLNLKIESPALQLNTRDLDTLFSECLGGNELQQSMNDLDFDPADDLTQYFKAFKLRDHQKQALRWMLWRENQLRYGACEQDRYDSMWEEHHFLSNIAYYVNPFEKVASLSRPKSPLPCLSGILADDMGMGKTMMMLSLVAYQKYIREEQSAMVNDNYLGRVNAKLSGKSLVICPLSLLHQWKNEAQERFRAKTLSVYVYYGDDRDEKAGLCVGSITKCDLVLTTYGVISAESEKNGILANFEWSRIILDEAHSIKNRATGYHKACLNLRATHRWCLTGTPIQNSLDDIFALICFLQYEPWNQVALWKRVIKKPYDDGDEVNALGRLKSLLTPILLRRTKHSRDKHGNLIITIPPKRIDLIELEFSKDERAFYQAVFDKSRAEFNGFVASGAASTNYVAIFALLLRLRQACNHPFLALGKKSVLKPDERRNMALTTKSAFRPCQNEGADAYYNRIAAHLQTDMQASRNTSYSAKSLTPSYIQNILAQVEDGSCSEECPVCLDPPQDAILTPCGHVLCDKCLRDSLASDLDNGCPLCRSVVDLAKVFKLMPAESSTQTEGSQAGINTDFILPRATNEDEFESVKLQQLLRDLQAIKVGNNKFPQQRRKVVIFSQWMSMLHMVSKLLTRHSFTHCMFHGGLSQEARERVLAKFANQPEVEVLVISLKAGGIGLNLTCASVVILLDPWWNPGVEEQAIDRVHRLGQMQDVIVKRYVVKNTVEDTILLLQQRKKNLANHALVVGKAHDERQRDRLDLDDMRIFFR